VSEVANKWRLVETVNALVKKSAPELEDIDAACSAFSAVLSDLLQVKASLRLEIDSDAVREVCAKLDKSDPAWDL
jgi:hypothetical protein